jgi:hypothetical protein
MKITSTFDIGQTIEFSRHDDYSNSFRGVIFAITVADVGPGTVGFWYKVFLSDATEVEIAEAGYHTRLVK